MARPNLFGADIAGAIHHALGSQLLSATLTQFTPGTRAPGSLTAGRHTGDSSTDYPCVGFTEDYTERQIDGTIIKSGDRKVMLLGKSLPDAIDPRPGDVIAIEGADWKIVGPVKRDPAGATFTCQVRR